MEQFQRRLLLAMGGVLLIVGVALVGVWIAGDERLRPFEALGGVTLAGGGLAFLFAGRRERTTVAGRTVGWWQWSGVGYLLLGGYFFAAVLEGGLSSLFDLILALTGVTFALFGVQQFRNGEPGRSDEFSGREIAILVVGGTAMVLVVGLVLVFVE